MPFGMPSAEDTDQVSKLAMLLAGAKAAGVIPPDGAPPSAPAPPPAATPAMPAAPATAASLGYGMSPSAVAPSAAATPTAVTPPPETAGMGAASLGRRPLPVPPVAPPDPSVARALITQQRDQYAKPTDPNVVKPKWWDRLLGGAVGFSEGYAHNPNATQDASNFANRRYNQAEALRQKNLEGVNEKLGDFDANAGASQRNFENQQSNFRNSLDVNKEQRMLDNEQALAKERGSKAKRYDEMTYTERAKVIPEVEGALGRPLDDDERKFFVVNGKLPTKEDSDTPASVEKALFSSDPKTRTRAESLWNREHPGRSASDEAAADRQAARADREYDKYQTRLSNWQNKKSEIDKDQTTGYQKIEDKFSKEFDKVKGKPDTDADKKALNDRLSAEKQQHEASIQRRYSLLGSEPAEPASAGSRSNKTTPASTPSAPAKVATQAQVDAYAKSKGWTSQQAASALKGAGYTIQ